MMAIRVIAITLKKVDSAFIFKNVGKETVYKTIESLPTKNNCDSGGISSKLLKIIEPAITK